MDKQTQLGYREEGKRANKAVLTNFVGLICDTSCYIQLHHVMKATGIKEQPVRHSVAQQSPLAQSCA